MPLRDWVEKTKDTKGFIIWTSTVASTAVLFTWAAFKFIFDDNKIASFEAKAQAAEGKASQYSAKVDVLESENLNLRSENQRFRSWLESDPKSFLALSKIIDDQDKQIKKIVAECGGPQAKQQEQNGKYALTAGLKKGEAFVDPKTNAVFGVADVNIDNEVTGTITYPNGKTQPIQKIRPGQVWDYESNGRKYQLILKKSGWIDNAVIIESREK